MNYQIYNNGPSLKIVSDGSSVSVSKKDIQEITVVREDVIKIDMGSKCASIYLRRSQITLPGGSVDDLITTVNLWIMQTVCFYEEDGGDTPTR